MRSKMPKGSAIDWVNLPLDDKPTFDLLNQGKTLGVFQLESGGMQDLARQLHLDRFEEIIAVGLPLPARPDGHDPLLHQPQAWPRTDRKRPSVDEGHFGGDLRHHGLSGAGDADRQQTGQLSLWAKAMCCGAPWEKKIWQQMAQQREKFRLGAAENGIDSEVSMLIFDKMEKFAAYGFNKSHAAAYGFLSYVTAYLKANYPKEWMAALMTCDQIGPDQSGQIHPGMPPDGHRNFAP